MTATDTRPSETSAVTRLAERHLDRLADSPAVSGEPGAGAIVERVLSFFLPFVALLVAAFELSLRYHSIIGDAASREANGYYVFFSNDPHLAAIGFVWNPLASITDMPLILLKGIWPALTVDELAAAIMSSIFMAGACYQLVRFMQDLGVRPIVRWALLACFILDPMIYFYGASGMSEALFIFTLLAATRRLAGWLQTERLRDLVASGVWLGVAYAARNEAAMSAAFASVVVLVVSYLRADGPTRIRRLIGITDAVIFSLPFIASFVGWAGVSWVIVGHPFEQFSSVYGTSSQLRLGAGSVTSASKVKLLKVALGGVESLAPFLPLAAVAAALRARKERDLRVLAILSILGGVLFFEVPAFSLGLILDSYRYLIYAIPLMVTLAAFLARPLPKSPAERSEEAVRTTTGNEPRYLRLRRRRRVQLSVCVALGSILLVVPGGFTAYHEMFHSTIGLEESDQLSWILHPNSAQAHVSGGFREQYSGIKRETAMLDALHAGAGGIMVDDADGCVPQMILASKHPTQFTIPNDVHFIEDFGAPYQRGIRYLLVSKPGATGTLDSLDREWPTLYQNGAGLGTLVNQATLPACTTFKLYRLFPVTA